MLGGGYVMTSVCIVAHGTGTLAFIDHFTGDIVNTLNTEASTEATLTWRHVGALP